MDEPLRVRDDDETPEVVTGKSRLRWVLRDVLVPVLVVGAAFWGLGRLRAPDLPDQAPDFALSALDGQVVRLSALRGQSVVLNFWATWCGPCQIEMPLLRTYAEENPEVPVLFVAVDGEVGALTEYARSHDLPLGRVLRIDAETKAAYGVSTLPTTVVVNAEGGVGASHAGVLMPGQLGWMVGG